MLVWLARSLLVLVMLKMYRDTCCGLEKWVYEMSCFMWTVVRHFNKLYVQDGKWYSYQADKKL